MFRLAVVFAFLIACPCLRAAISYVPSNTALPPVAREFRGAWVASVNNIDWPSRRLLTTEQQKAELLAILDKCAALKLNVVVFQVRPACDALYASRIEPWSEYLTGVQGKAPNPFWDPLEFAVNESHKRGLELHAWFNPFRARHSTGSRNSLAANHISKTRPELAKSYGTHLWLDPGLQEVHEYSARVILDVVTRYDIDGVHIDDYFYPYRETNAAGKIIPFPDDASWSTYQRSGGKLSRDDWRRDNVNRFVARMYRDVHAAKAWVKVGVSPFGIYRPGFPAQVKGFDQYQSIYADPHTWLVNGWVDYLAPQLYWRIDPPAQSFPVLLKWWTENNPKRRMIVPGLNTTAIGALGNYNVSDAGNKGWPASEILRQVEITRQQPGVAGHIHWNMGALMKNKGGVNDLLSRSCYEQPALTPAMNGVARSPAPKIAARAHGSRVDFELPPIARPDVRYWVIQARREDGSWDLQIDPARTLTWTRSPAPSVFAIRSVDKFGNLSDATVLQRTEIQPRIEVQAPRKTPSRRGK